MQLLLPYVICSNIGCNQDKTEFITERPLILLELEKIKEPSGICFHAVRKSLFVVDDSGGVFEFKTDGRLVNHKQIRSADFEGITHDPATGFLYVAIEGADSILELDPETLEPKREFAIPREFQGKTLMKKGGQGIEGITFVPDRDHPHGGTFFVANQSFHLEKKPKDISAIFELEIPLKAKPATASEVIILRFFKPGVIDISGLHYDASRNILYAISDSTNRMLAYDRSGTLLRSWDLPGKHQEGIAMDPDGTVYIAQDSGNVLKWRTD